MRRSSNKVNKYLKEHDTEGLDIQIMKLTLAMRHTLERARHGEDTIAATGNVLRDYLTDLFPIMELGTSAKMYSIVPLMAGGGLYETGAGGSAPKHVQQFEAENHLRWDSLGEFLALKVSLDDIAVKTGNAGPRCWRMRSMRQRKSCSRTTNRRPGRRVSRTTGPVTTTWACTGRKRWRLRTEDAALKEQFAPLAKELAANEEQIIRELVEIQGDPVDIGGYYHPDVEKADAAMRPSATLNGILAG